MKLTKEELINKVDSLAIEDEIKIELMEDITDSFGEMAAEVDNSENEELRKSYEDLAVKYEDLKARYKERFLADNSEEDEKKEIIEEEKEDVIDVKEI